MLQFVICTHFDDCSMDYIASVSILSQMSMSAPKALTTAVMNALIQWEGSSVGVAQATNSVMTECLVKVVTSLL